MSHKLIAEAALRLLVGDNLYLSLGHRVDRSHQVNATGECLLECSLTQEAAGALPSRSLLRKIDQDSSVLIGRPKPEDSINEQSQPGGLNMAYIPEGARWYLAELVIEFRIEAEPENLVHVNTVLVEAASPEEAYDRSLLLGTEHSSTFTNTDGRSVTSVFVGLRDLSVVHDDFVHGAELMYEALGGLTEKDLARMVSPRSELTVFAPTRLNQE